MYPFRFGVQPASASSGERRAGRAPIAGLAAAATATGRLRIGSFVSANDDRHPLVLAREAAALEANTPTVMAP